MVEAASAGPSICRGIHVPSQLLHISLRCDAFLKVQTLEAEADTSEAL